MFRRVTGPLGSVLEFIRVEAGVNDFFKFVLGLSVYLNRRRRSLDLGRKLIVFVWFEE